MQRRNFFKTGLLAALATTVAPLAWSLGAESFPEYENGQRLAKVFRLEGVSHSLADLLAPPGQCPADNPLHLEAHTP